MTSARKAGPPKRRRAAPRRFSERDLERMRRSRMLAIRAGTSDHRFTGIWFVLVRNRLFVRPWNDKPTGWREAFRTKPLGAITVATRVIPVRVRPARGESLFDAMDRAYAEKYPTPGSRKWVRGFALTRRRKTSLELLPR